MAMRTPQPSANLFITIIDNRQRSFFQDRSDLRSDHLPLTALFRKCVGPDEFSAEEIFSLKPPCVRTVTFDAYFRTFVSNLHERLLLLRMNSHDALIVCQTNEQVNPVDAAPSPPFPREAATRASQLRFSKYQ